MSADNEEHHSAAAASVAPGPVEGATTATKFPMPNAKEERVKSVESSRGGVWDEEEHKLFLECLKRVPADSKNRWKSISQVIKTRTSTQVRTHAQKFFKKLRLQEERKAREQQQLDQLRQQAQAFIHKTHTHPYYYGGHHSSFETC